LIVFLLELCPISLKNLKSATKARGHLIYVGSARLLLEDDMSGAEKEVIVKINHS